MADRTPGNLPGELAPGAEGPAERPPEGPLRWLREQGPFLQRLVLAQALAPPRGLRPWWRERGPLARASGRGPGRGSAGQE